MANEEEGTAVGRSRPSVGSEVPESSEAADNLVDIYRTWWGEEPPPAAPLPDRQPDAIAESNGWNPVRTPQGLERISLAEDPPSREIVGRLEDVERTCTQLARAVERVRAVQDELRAGQHKLAEETERLVNILANYLDQSATSLAPHGGVPSAKRGFWD